MPGAKSEEIKNRLQSTLKSEAYDQVLIHECEMLPPALATPISSATCSATVLSRSNCPSSTTRLFISLCIVDKLVLIAFSSISRA